MALEILPPRAQRHARFGLLEQKRIEYHILNYVFRDKLYDLHNIKHTLFPQSKARGSSFVLSSMNRALDVFFSKNIFIIDVAAIYDSSASCIDLQIKLLHKFWITQTPALVQSSLRRVSRLILRLPVPSTEAAVHRGREELNWMDGSDGHGGGGYKMRSLKEEVEDAMIIQKCVQSIASMRVVPAQTGKAISRPSRSLGRPRRSKSLKNMRSTSHRRGEDSITNGIEDIEKRPLRLLEIILVKRSSRALVLREVLGLVHILKDIEVRGTRRVCFELNGKKTVWATKRKETWDDRVSNTEPDGAKLLRDLQHLQTWRPLDIEPITSPTEFKYVSLNEEGRLLISPTALRHATLGFHNAIIPVTPRLRTGLAGQKPRTDSFAFIMEQGIMLLQGVPTPREKGVELECQGDNDEENEVGSRR
ncbi:hypothetical protein BU16DRAFT_622069 [Lophium mytilinum]|uniref:Uncharacterized protein n=1 Tax=Lophium mytilinum TaxID=390894 RepID=A0A6A6QDW1_9PEZI|nr:hypothetical protein BU16DRAFT_622069 [Lophium mytilinum]